MAMPAEKMTSEIGSERWKFLFGVRRSIRYHLLRLRHYELFHAWVNGVNVVAGSTAFGTLIGPGNHYYVATSAALIVTVLSALDLIIGTSGKARLHKDLANDFIALEKEILLAGHLTEDRLRELEAKRLDIETKEPPILRALNRVCHNEEARAQGCEDQSLPLYPYQRALSQWISFEPPRHI
jgi:hypothetical protein